MSWSEMCETASSAVLVVPAAASRAPCFCCARLCGAACAKTGENSEAEHDHTGVNPRPGWSWPEERGEASQVSRDFLGFARETALLLRLEYNWLYWQHVDDGRKGLVDLGAVYVHGDVEKVRCEATPVLDIEDESRRVPLVIKFSSLEVMNHWWCAIAETQQLVRQLKVERGEADDDDDVSDNDGALHSVTK